jgi:hypothetical protein
MTYGPFSLVGATDAKLDFYRWLNTESGYDYVGWLASVNDSNYYGYQTSGDQRTWTSQNFDLKNVPTLGNLCGQSQVWIAFVFRSDISNEFEGAYVDDVVLQKYTNTGQPDLTFYQPTGWDFPIVPSNVIGTHTVPSPLPAGTTYIDWAGANVGNAATDDTFFCYLYLDNSPIAGWYCAPPVNPGFPFGAEDWETSIPAGNHALMTLQDSTNRIAESNETNNRYSHSWTWGGGGGPYEHVTITSSALSASFAPLTSFLFTYLGLHDTVVTTEYIYSSQSGRDNAEKVRNFIKYAYQNWQTTYVLLGGDVEVVPQRKTYPGQVSGQNDTIPCDLYFSGLDGDWDANGNSVFGEMGDNVDMGPDVYVGRAPVSNATEAARFVSKTIAYGSGGSSHRQKVLLTGFDLDTNNTHGQTTMDYYDNNYINSPFTCKKVYDSQGGNHRDSILNCLNQGYHYFIHIDHGNATSLGAGYKMHGWLLTNSDMSALTNGFDKLSVFMSTACLVGAFDQSDCVMEAFMNAANGGGVATMSNSRSGWYYRGENPQVSLSAAFLEKFVARVFSHGTNPAETKDFLLGKADLAGQAASDTIYRWCMYDYNLFGEPALKMVNLSGLAAEPNLSPAFRTRIRAVTPSVFSGSTTVELELARRQQVRLVVYDASGRQVASLVSGLVGPGRHLAVWDGRTFSGADAPAGVYVVALRTDAGDDTRKVVRYAGKE